MLTAFQCEVVPYLGDGDVYCPLCATAHDLGRSQDDAALSRYSVEDEWPEGLYCGDCGLEIAEPSEDYCTEHEGWHSGATDSGLRYCDQAMLSPEDTETVDPCRFPEDSNPNPPVPRWVPCSACGARDGESHRDRCHTLGEVVS